VAPAHSAVTWCSGGKGDDQATRNLVHAATPAGEAHLAYISVVGADRVPVTGRIDRTMFGYFKMKRKAEPIDADEVAEYLVGLALARPAGLVPDIAGPRVYGASELVRTYLDATDKRRLIAPITMPRAAARAIRACANLAPSGSGPGKTFWPSGFRPPPPPRLRWPHPRELIQVPATRCRTSQCAATGHA
jgi:uncharacterized protein YbjT (DUF2867 family)